MTRLRTGFLISLILAVASIAVEHAIESNITGQVSDISSVENKLIAGSTFGQGKSSPSPANLAASTVNMTVQTVALTASSALIRQLTEEATEYGNFTYYSAPPQQHVAISSSILNPYINQPEAARMMSLQDLWHIGLTGLFPEARDMSR